VIGAWIIAFAPVAGLAVNTVSEIAGAHILFRTNLAASIIAGALLGLAATCAVLQLGLAKSAPVVGIADVWCVGLLTYLALACGFLAFLNLNVTSLRIRMLRTVLGDGDGGMSMTTLEAQYTPAERLHRRLARLQSGGQIRRDGDRWRISSRQLLFVARLIDGLRRLVLPPQHR
jgi:hypothetical protein